MNRLEALKLLRETVSKETGLIANRYMNDNGKPCTLGTLIPLEERIKYSLLSPSKRGAFWYNRGNQSVETFIDFREQNYSLASQICLANNSFDGTDEGRRDYMLGWLDEKIAKMEAITAAETIVKTEEKELVPA